MRTSPRRLASAESALPRRPPPNVVAGIVLLAIVGGVLLWQGPWRSDDAPDASDLPGDATVQLDEVLREMSRAEDREAFVSAGDVDEQSGAFLQDAWSARDELGVTEVSLRLLDGGDVADRDDGTAGARVRVSWSTDDSVLAGATVREADLLLRVAGTDDGRVSLRSVEPDGAPVPLWLAGSVEVDRTEEARVVRVDGGVPDLQTADLAERAAGTVRSTLPADDDMLTIVSPATTQTAAALLGRSLDELERVAAVTTTVDGSRETPRLVVLNPEEFETMDRRAAQVVLTHEAVHQLTGIVGTRTETWVAEGFADWVALRDDDAPLALSAGQVLRQVQQDGPPGRLPTREDFESAEHGIGAVYESAWMIFRMLDDDQVAEQDIVDFYLAVLDGEPTDDAARRTLGRSVEQITRQWQDYLTKSASTLS